MLSDTFFSELLSYYVSTDPATGIDLYLIPRANELLEKNPRLVDTLLAQCEKVETSTWVKKFPLLHSTFEMDCMILLLSARSVVGFASMGKESLRQNCTGLYLSEIMIKPAFQKRGLSRWILETFHHHFVDHAPKNELFLTFFLSGHLALFRSMLSLKCFDCLSLNALDSETQTAIEAYLQRDIGSHCISEEGIVRAAWAPQPVSQEAVWSEQGVASYGFPKDVKLTEGDALIRVFRTDRNRLARSKGPRQGWLAKLTSALFLSATLLLFSGCFSQTPRTYTKPLIDRIGSLDPAQTRFRHDYMIARGIQGQLLSLDSLGEVRPALVASWEINREGTRYVFKIRPGVRFHSGKVASVDDAIFTLNYLAAKDSLVNQLFSDVQGFEAYNAGKTDHLKGVRKLSEDSFEVLLSSPSFVFLVNLADPKVAVVPQALNQQTRSDFFKKPDGIGPFKFTSLTPDGSELVLKANENYFLGKPKLSAIHFIRMERDDAVRAFKEGKVQDLEVFTIPIKQHEDLRKYGNQFSISAYSTSFLFFNGRNKVFSDLSARKQLAAALDVNPLAIQCDVPYIKSTGFIPHGVLGWADPKYGGTKPGNDSAKSKKVSWRTPLNFITYGDDYPKCVVEGLVRQLVASGIPVNYEHIPTEQIVGRLEKGNYDLFFEYLSVRGSEPYHLVTYFHPQSRHNIIWFKDPTIAEWSEKIKSSPAKQVRAAMYRQLDRYLTDDKVYFIPLFSDVRHYFFAKNVEGATIPGLISTNNGFEEIGLE